MVFYNSSGKRSTTKGFSLMELLMAIAIILLLVAVTLVGFGNYARTQQYQRFVEEVGHNLRLAKQRTVASKEDTVYGFYVGTSTVELFIGDTPEVGSSSNTILDFSGLPYYATSSLSDGNWYVSFARVTGEASATGTITVVQPDLGRTATFTIYATGLVE